MSKDEARVWLVKASLGATAGVFAIFLALPVFTSTISFNEILRLIEIIAPVFLGYLGMASHFLFRAKPPQSIQLARGAKSPGGLFPLLVKGPVIVFVSLVVVTLAAFLYSNRPSATGARGMTIDVLAGVLSAELALLTVATSIISANLFATTESPDTKPEE